MTTTLGTTSIEDQPHETRGYLGSLFDRTSLENRRVILSMLERSPRSRLLDLGCYDGQWTEELADRIGTTDVHGVEVVPAMAERASRRGVQVVSADLNGALPYETGSFDVIHANQVIEHLHDTDMFASEIRRLLRRSGYAIVSTNNLASLHNIASLVLGRQPPPAHVSSRISVGNDFDPHAGEEHGHAAMSHLRIFSYRALRDFLGAYDLEVEVQRTVGFYPFPVPVARVLTRALPIYGAYLTYRVRPL